jgi:hypothetical protein
MNKAGGTNPKSVVGGIVLFFLAKPIPPGLPDNFQRRNRLASLNI